MRNLLYLLYRNDLSKIFIKNELKAFQGSKNINVFIFSTILFFSLSGLGHSLGGLMTLKKRMSNPFSNWLKVPIGYKKEDNAIKFENKLNNDSIKIKYGIQEVSGYEIDYLFFYNKSITNKFPFKSRSIYKNEPLLQKIIEPSNVISSNYKNNNVNIFEDNCWIIVTENLLNRLRYDKINNIVYLPVSVSTVNENYLTHFVKVAYVVKELPDLCDIVLPVYLHGCFTKPAYDSKYIDISSSAKLQLLLFENQNIDSVSAFIKTKFKIEDLSIDSLIFNNNKFIKLSYYLKDDIDFGTKNAIIDSITNMFTLVKRIDDYTCLNGNFKIDRPNYLSISMNDLSKVRVLKEFAESPEYKLEISMAQVENKENFGLVTKLTFILATLLYILSLIAIVVFVYSIINNHFDKISPNLGTLKAFGLSNKELIHFYMITIIIFFIKSSGLTFLFAVLYYFIIKILSGDFILFHWLILLSFLIIVIFIMVISKIILNRKLLNSPGDLIYQREK